MKKPESQLWTDVRAAIKSPFTSVGGYPLYCYTSDGETVHPKCVGKEFLRFKASTDKKETDGYQIVAVQVYWEGPDETCACCNKPCESAYGDPDPNATKETK